MNPGPPPYQGGAKDQSSLAKVGEASRELTPRVPAPLRPLVDNRLVEGFRAWLSGSVSGDTAEYCVGVVEPGRVVAAEGQAREGLAPVCPPPFSIGGLKWEQYQSYLLFLKTPNSNKHRLNGNNAC